MSRMRDHHQLYDLGYYHGTTGRRLYAHRLEKGPYVDRVNDRNYVQGYNDGKRNARRSPPLTLTQLEINARDLFRAFNLPTRKPTQ